MSQLQYRTDIQGLRAIAVGTVVLFHAWPHLLTGGYIGVDVFFVISGFLISSILLRDLDAGRFSITEFYRRRVRRIFPALFVVVAATLILGWLTLDPEGYKWLARTALSATLFVSNIDFYLTLWYFSPQAEQIPLLHTWSLAVEEQYYLFFPLLLWAVTRWTFGRRHLFALTTLTVIAGIGLSQWAIGWSVNGSYYLLPFRAFELLLGVMAAFAPAPDRWSRTMREVFAAAGMLVVLACAVFYTPQTVFPGLWAALPTAAAALVLYVGRSGTTLTAKGLSLKPMVFIGGISYSLYLWHWPLMAFPRIETLFGQVSDLQMGAILGLTVLLAWLTYRFVEQPVMRLKTTEFGFLKAGGAGMAVIAGIAGGLYVLEGVPGRFSPNALQAFAGQHNYSPLREACHKTDGDRVGYDQTCVLGQAERADIVVWGDSHGAELAYALHDKLGAEVALRQMTASACPPVVGVEAFDRRNCVAENTRLFEALVTDPHATQVVLAMNRAGYDLERDEVLFDGLTRVVEPLLEAGKTVVLVGQIPNAEIEVPRMVGKALARGHSPAALGRAREDVDAEAAKWDALLGQLATRYDLPLVKPETVLCGADLCPIVSETGDVLYFNPTHVSIDGAYLIAEQVQQALGR